MPLARLKEQLDSEKVKYVVISHSPAYTSQEIAASAHIAGGEIAKTVMVKLDGEMAMAVLPAPLRVDLDSLAQVAGAARADLAEEEEFERLFPGCELGAMPPFGNLWDMPVYVDERLTEDEAIAFNAGSHTELIQMRFDDFQRLVQPVVIAMTHGVGAH